ncbi:MAG: hypothetical protein ACO3PW_09925 [Gemmobacter sp.]
MRWPRALRALREGAPAEVAQGDVVLCAHHPILRDLAATLAGPAFALPRGRAIELLVGVHDFARRRPPGRLRIALQTEQLADAQGRPLWAARLGRELGGVLGRCDALIDLSPFNANAYARLPPADRARVLFGPYIFPDRIPDFVPGTGPELVFFGALNPRRAAALARISARRPVRVLPPGTFGPALMAALAPAAGILNLHFAEGEYTEAPRLLTALMAGKPVYSEPLAPPLVPGRHYLGPEADADAATRAAVFAAFRDEVAARFRLSEGIARAAALAGG